ncbi:MAG: universal stress protein [Thermoprotei archaeon]|nr:MAG: universal stress protein [Thermoprotei archaeon]
MKLLGKVKKILVGVDGSAVSYRAADFALELASSLKADVLAVHVIPPLPADYASLGAKVEVSVEEIDRKILHEVRVMGYTKNIKLETKVLKGRPAEVINSVAESEGCDLIVLGCIGVGGAYRRLMGSVATEVVNTSKKPVLLVK